ncbi:MAG TPA: hypothetical protein VGQ36_26815 [Thermoanaerobaculia bacterium]|nr:hypothetical protein [Thermoanaerobaculia bacterium]
MLRREELPESRDGSLVINGIQFKIGERPVDAQMRDAVSSAVDVRRQGVAIDQHVEGVVDRDARETVEDAQL